MSDSSLNNLKSVFLAQAEPKIGPAPIPVISWSPSIEVLRQWLRDGAEAIVKLVESGQAIWDDKAPSIEETDPVALLISLLKRRGFKDAAPHWENPALIWVGSFYLGVTEALDLVEYMQRNKLMAENISKARLRKLSLG